MRSVRLLGLAFMLAVMLTSCSQTATPPSSTSLARAHAYLATALDDMQRYSLHRKIINWTQVRQQAFAHAAGATTPAETYAAIQYALTALKDHHSFFWDPPTAKQILMAGLIPDESPVSQQFPGGIGYLRLPLFEGWQQAAIQYAQAAQGLIRGIDQAGNTCGWIVDLQEDGGGNAWSMLDGVGPILGVGTVGGFVFPDGSKQAWSYRDGQVQIGGATQLTIAGAYQLKHPNPPVAILTGQKTGSAGEAIVVAFRGRPLTRSFGDRTYGIPTTTKSFTLSDGAILAFAVALDADRTGQAYDGPIPPDQYVASNPRQIDKPADPVIQAATSWLHTQPACRG